jgi:hypothetical protein
VGEREEQMRWRQKGKKDKSVRKENTTMRNRRGEDKKTSKCTTKSEKAKERERR